MSAVHCALCWSGQDWVMIPTPLERALSALGWAALSPGQLQLPASWLELVRGTTLFQSVCSQFLCEVSVSVNLRGHRYAMLGLCWFQTFSSEEFDRLFWIFLYFLYFFFFFRICGPVDQGAMLMLRDENLICCYISCNLCIFPVFEDQLIKVRCWC